MIVLDSLAEAKLWRKNLDEGETLALVPTMGALHEGHRSLLRAARARCDTVVLTIFVNPRQFSSSEDLDEYPQRVKEDLDAAAADGVDLVWLARAQEVYPPGFATQVSLPALADRLCGKSRPHHFGGVALVVLKLFNIFTPDEAFFGDKDYQQATIIDRLVADLDLDIEIVRCPLIREPDGIALSSRNRNLTAEGRVAARALSKGLFTAGELYRMGERIPSRLLLAVSEVIRSEPRAEMEYLELLDPVALDPIDQRVPQTGAVLLVAVSIDGVRLIDNLLLPAGGEVPGGISDGR